MRCEPLWSKTISCRSWKLATSAPRSCGVCGGKDLLPVAGAVPLSSAELLAPLAHSCKFFCIGLNYYSHMAEAPPQPGYPIIFTKFPSVLIGPDDEIQLPRSSDTIDWGG